MPITETSLSTADQLRFADLFESKLPLCLLEGDIPGSGSGNPTLLSTAIDYIETPMDNSQASRRQKLLMRDNMAATLNHLNTTCKALIEAILETGLAFNDVINCEQSD